MSAQDHTDSIRAAVVKAVNSVTAVNISAGKSKSFYGNECSASPLDVSRHTGVIDYEPSELYITARCGTRMHEIEGMLREHKQMLQFEPPHFGDNATIGGTVACGLSGPRRPYTGSVRDSVLGVHIINGKGDYLRFGGQVMKNVAGFDVARLMCGALGTLGIIMQVSLKVVPQPAEEITLCFEFKENEALRNMVRWTQSDLPITATYFEDRILYVRVAGIESTLRTVAQILGGEKQADNETFWYSVKEQRREFFHDPAPLWRLSVPADVATPVEFTDCVIEWNGGVRWIKTELAASRVFTAAEQVSGTATLFKSNQPTDNRFQPLNSSAAALHANIKHAFDPAGLFNPGKMYS